MPFYLGASGLPQPGNALLFVLLPLVLAQWNGKLPSSDLRTLRPLLVFTLWTILVNAGWAIINGKVSVQDYAIFPLYYVFNAIVFFAALLAYRQNREHFLTVTGYVVFVMVMFQVMVSLVMRSAAPRPTLFFNNPNQLGYYAVLSACLLAIVQLRKALSLVLATVGLLGCAYLSVLSASRAATAGIAMLLVLLVFSNIRLILLGIVASFALLSVGNPVSDAIDYRERRALLERDANTSFVEERGYDRLWNFKEHLVLGAGEGDLERFSSAKETREIHSSAATILFSYGIIGTILFALFAYRVVVGARARMTIMMVPTFAYTIAHQGLRFSMLWVLLAVFVAAKHAERAES
jgi:hypothetical protein